MFVYKHTETKEFVKNQPTLYKFDGWITREFLRLRMRNFQGIIFIWIWIYKTIFKSTLV